MKTKYNTIILGAGMAGLGASIELTKRGIDNLIIERSNQIGGLCGELKIGQYNIDYGPKILILDDSDNSQEILSYLGNNYQKYPVDESVWMSKYGLMSFPLQRNLIDLPKTKRLEILEDIATTKPIEVKSYRDWLASSYGRKFCEMILFPYEEKKWQMSLDKMDYQWALTRPVKVNLEEVVKGAFQKLPPNRSYYYPKKGSISLLTKNMAKEAGKILTSAKITEIELVNKTILLANNKKFTFKHLISSIPLDDFGLLVKNPYRPLAEDEEKFKRLAVMVVNLVFKGDHKLKGTAIYLPEKNIIFRRLSILNNLCPGLKQKGVTILQAEISINPDIAIPGDYLGQVTRGIEKMGIFQKMPELLDSSTEVIPFAYPLQLNGLSEYVKNLQLYYRQFDVYHCGRGGNYDYCNSDQAYRQGKEAAFEVSLTAFHRFKAFGIITGIGR